MEDDSVWTIPGDWANKLHGQSKMEYWTSLRSRVETDRAAGPVYPAASEVFNAFKLTPLSTVRVVILGQDPYHGPGQAHGLAFSARDSVPAPPSLRNLLREAHSDLGIQMGHSHDLSPWASRGVLLLNAALTVRDGEANSHAHVGWQTFTDSVISVVSECRPYVVFILWGAFAQKKSELIDQEKHGIIQSVHPSPLSASRGFFGSRPFSSANQLLRAHGGEPMDWALP